MNPLFADAVYFIGLANPQDQHHLRAKQIDVAGRSMVTTHYVLTEVANALSHRSLRNRFLRLLAFLEGWPDVLVLPCHDALYRDGLDLFRERPDKDRSLTDCISFVVTK